jgi:hypothetical protein
MNVVVLILRTVLRGGIFQGLRRLPFGVVVVALLVAAVLLVAVDARAGVNYTAQMPASPSAVTLGNALAQTTAATLTFTLTESRPVSMQASVLCTTCTNGVTGFLEITGGGNLPGSLFPPSGAPQLQGAAATVSLTIPVSGMLPAGSYSYSLKVHRVGNSGPVLQAYGTRITAQIGDPVTHDHDAVYCRKDGSETDSDCVSSGGGSSAWADITGKPATFPPDAHNHDDRYYTEAEADGRYSALAHLHTAVYCDADGTEADPDCGAGGADLSNYYNKTEVDGIASLASDTCGGPSLPACNVSNSEQTDADRAHSGYIAGAIVGTGFFVMLLTIVFGPRGA